MSARYIVGIDLGTTNSALAYIDSAEVPRRLLCFAVPQLVGPGDVAAMPTLPSVHHHVGEFELPPGATRLPFLVEAAAPDYVVGELARSQAQAVPGRAVTSAKSWLCHPRVDRLRDFLPWGGGADVIRISPVEASARYLRHMTAALRHVTGIAVDAEGAAEVVLTVPASFDEVARELTVEAARRAGLNLAALTLLEEPQAAFYSWLADHARYAEEVEAGDLILVCDIGGGTTDFTLIAVQKTAGRVSFQRTAVGDHLLLGGDNMDLALARRVERQVVPSGPPLPPATFQGLVQACRSAKERLLSDAPPPGGTIGVHVAGRGSKVIGGGLQVDLALLEVASVLLDGFFPVVEAGAEPQRARSGLQELGLPYAADPAVTRYLAAFLRQHGARPTALLFNGGVLRSTAIRARILDVMEGWLGQRPRVLTNDAPDLAVARGAAYYGLARRGEGLRITGGAARAFYIEVEGAALERPAVFEDASSRTYVCLTPRGLEEGVEVGIDDRGAVRRSAPEAAGAALQLITNRPVRFRLFSSALRQGDQAGDVLRLPAGELQELPPLYTVLRHPRTSQERPIAVSLRARITEIGTLELWAASREAQEASSDGDGAVKEPPLRWRLQFDLRSAEGPLEDLPAADPVDAAAQQRGARPSEPPSAQSGPSPEEQAQAGLVSAATELIDGVFAAQGLPPAGLPKALQAVLGPKESWNTALLRALWEPLKRHREGRGRTAAHEARWLNLTGYCLRPGFGYPLDDWRVKEAWRVWNAGLSHERDDACRLEWWILWRRIAGGLSRTQQDEIWKRVAPLVLPAQRRLDRKPPKPQEAAEVWRTLAACERLEVRRKVELGEALLAVVERRSERASFGYWALGRLGGRAPLYGSIDNVVPKGTVETWLDRLLALPVPVDAADRAEVAQAVAELARRCGDRVRDVNEGLRKKLMARLQELMPDEEGEGLVRALQEVVPRKEREERFAFGDSLPVGLRLVGEG